MMMILVMMIVIDDDERCLTVGDDDYRWRMIDDVVIDDWQLMMSDDV